MSSNVSRIAPLAGELARFARWLVGDRADADDVIQETLLRALRARDVPSEAPALRAWLFRIARNAHIDRLRAAAARDRLVVLEGGREDLEEVEAGRPAPFAEPVDRVDLERALAALPVGARAALVLADVWELALTEIAEILDVPVGTVKSRVARARARLAKLLGAPDEPLLRKNAQ